MLLTQDSSTMRISKALENGDDARRSPDVQDESRLTPDRVLGTLAFASAGVLRGEPCTYRDDLISLAYTLVYLLQSSLPWSSLELDADLEMSSINEESSSNNKMHRISSANEDERSEVSVLDSIDVLISAIAAVKEETKVENLCGSLKDSPAARAIKVIYEHAISLPVSSGNSAVPNFGCLRNSIEKIAREDAESDGAAISTKFQCIYDWELSGLRWSHVDGTICHDLYKQEIDCD